MKHDELGLDWYWHDKGAVLSPELLTDSLMKPTIYQHIDISYWNACLWLLLDLKTHKYDTVN